MIFRWLSRRFRRVYRAHRIFALLLALGLGLGGVILPVLSQQNQQSPQNQQPTMEDLQEWQKTIQEYQTGVGQQRQQIERLEQAAQERLDRLQENIDITDDQLTDVNQRLQEAEEILAALEQEQQVTEATYQTNLDATQERLKFLQRHRQNQTWAFLFDSETLNEFLDRRQRLRQVYAADQAQLEQLNQARDRLDRQNQQISFQKQQISQLRQSLEQQKLTYASEANVQEGLVTKLRGDRQALLAAEQQLERDNIAISNLLRDRLGYVPQDPPLIRGLGRLSYPINAPITSNFGWRTHPILGTRRLHNGTDFGADTGTPIRAADAGTVILSGWSGGYGNTVIINHGGGMTTLYAHASRLLVQEGQTVQQGQVIAEVGSTGLSTGPHLHFEVRINGDPQDPMAYL
ncbi:peptidoglycan DD-metalloendopeptidase family protein [Candidatus Synechococcus calcipolaris G9]|uniref:Peptidoglycan DD-metalloendopeptidase family protein n=1 Tax=Candidatus Synechococcus calcipolaris G9 TaxID=1497997 RepID=A0ABT6EZU8_9SYNE|nr:peptidoglycan DD-metalloendopeptidase family protein [Candidatus Synechococcus calcipolaris]MDG2991135.1 peptidoglycan DD-metalloendopeptidase family protein [Candidatus Synechococcus calcipolaris G9]